MCLPWLQKKLPGTLDIHKSWFYTYGSHCLRNRKWGEDSPMGESPWYIGNRKNRRFIAFFKIKAHIHKNETTLNSPKAKHSERRVGSRSEEHPVTLP